MLNPGYVNYVAVEAAEYMTRGDMASVTMQYSLRPSPLSLDRVDEGREQYRMLIDAINNHLRERPADKRPRIVLFGESLGAWTSQDAFQHRGDLILFHLTIISQPFHAYPAGQNPSPNNPACGSSPSEPYGAMMTEGNCCAGRSAARLPPR